MKALAILSIADWLALGWFFAVWQLYAWYARRASRTGATLLAVTNQWRLRWMLQATVRDPRVLDGVIVQSLSSSPAYYFSFAALAWFFSPLAFAIAAAVVAGVLYGREFHSQVLDVLRD